MVWCLCWVVQLLLACFVGSVSTVFSGLGYCYLGLCCCGVVAVFVASLGCVCVLGALLAACSAVYYRLLGSCFGGLSG